MTYEKVFTIWEYWDGPRTGLANYRGTPHAYFCEWSESDDDYADTFTLAPVSAEVLSLALEQWTIFRGWEAAFHRGEVSEETHPGLPGQNERYSELEAVLSEQVKASAATIRSIAIFRAAPNQSAMPKGVMRDLEVEWQDVT
jgi:hypothetical protein